MFGLAGLVYDSLSGFLNIFAVENGSTPCR
jgi:hypothetical protein